jgi:hypothetical protein
MDLHRDAVAKAVAHLDRATEGSCNGRREVEKGTWT